MLRWTGWGRPEISELCRERVCEDPVGRQIVETCGAADPEVQELQERGEKTREGGRKRA